MSLVIFALATGTVYIPVKGGKKRLRNYMKSCHKYGAISCCIRLRIFCGGHSSYSTCFFIYSVSSGTLIIGNQCSSDYVRINNYLFAWAVSGFTIKISHTSFCLVDLESFNILWIIFASLQGFFNCGLFNFGYLRVMSFT